MTKEEYIRLLNNSPAFSELNEKLRKFYSEAAPEYYEQYAKVFQKEQNFLLENKAELIAKNNEAVKNFTDDIKAGKKQFLKDAENAANEDAANEQSKLLKELNNQ